MCGICGAYAYGRSDLALDGELVAAMAATMAHRGPDDAGVYLSRDRRLGMGFRRLAIVDLSPGGHQPMINEDGGLAIVFNGEIYNHGEHRRWLESRGHRYRGRADTETIIHLYEEYGEDCVHYLRGMFAFAIWDEARGRLFMARDRLGIKPLYYTLAGGTLIFGSEIKSIVAFPGVKSEVDPLALSHYLTFMVPPAPLTMFRGIRKLPAGHRMTIDAGGEVRVAQYWNAATAAEQYAPSDQQWAERLLELLKESVRLRLMGDVPIGVLLSGGVDSSLIAALMAEASEKPINTFSVGFKDYPRYNELDYAREIAARVGAVHREVMIDHRDALDYLPQMVHSQDEPIGDWVCVPLYFVSRLVRESGVRVALVGEGADELFCGYPLYMASIALRPWRPLLARVPTQVYGTGAALASRLRLAGVGIARKPERLLQLLEASGGRFWGGAIAFRPADKRRLLATPLWQSDEIDASADFIESAYSRLRELRRGADTLEEMTCLELRHRLPELLLMRVDKIAMSVAVEARVPFLDHKLVEFALRIPQAIKIRGRRTKALIKQAAAGLIPERIIQRPKQGFAAPGSGWFRNELAKEVRATLLEGQMVKRGYLNRAFVTHLLDQHQACGYDRGVELWNLYNAEMWHRHWIS